MPTDPRYTSLTQEQVELIYQHHLIDNPPPPEDTKARDEDYESEESAVEGYDGEEAKEEGRLPIQDHESYADPEFDDEWNATDEEEEISPSEVLSENDSEDEFLGLGNENLSEANKGIQNHDEDKWEEV